MITSLIVMSSFGQCAPAYGQQAYAPVQYAQAYQQSYAAPYVEKTVFVAVEDPNSYYSSPLIGGQQRADQRAKAALDKQEAIAQRIDQLTAMIQALTKQVEGQSPPIPPGPVGPQSSSPPLPSPSDYGSESVPPPPTVGSLRPSQATQTALKVLQTNCAKCHTGEAASGGGFTILAQDGSLAPLEASDLLQIDQAVYSGSMPKGRPPLTADQYSSLRAWIGESKDQIASTLRTKKAKRS